MCMYVCMYVYIYIYIYTFHIVIASRRTDGSAAGAACYTNREV